MDTHPSLEELRDLARDALPAERARRVRLHLDDCSDCRARYDVCRADAGPALGHDAAIQDRDTRPTSPPDSSQQPSASPDRSAAARDDLESTQTTSWTADAMLNQTVGPYRILRKVGEGGMGVVFEAEQCKPIRRRVALKLIKLGMDTKEVIARFESERQALYWLVAKDSRKLERIFTFDDGQQVWW